MSTTGAQRVHAVFQVKAGGRTRIVVFDTQDLTLGRSPENDLAIDDPEISRKHCVFRRTPEGCTVEDRGTSNGTGVNGESVDRAKLSHGDVVRIGELEITYAETPRSPATLGPSVEYASQLKGFGAPQVARGDAEATILGLSDTITPGDEAFEVRPAGEFDPGLADLEPGAARDLDAELGDLETDPVEDFAFGTEATAAGAAAAPREPESAAGGDVWELDDKAPASAPQAAPGKLSLHLEIEGLEGELRRVVEGLAGKLLELPPLRVRIKSGDLEP